MSSLKLQHKTRQHLSALCGEAVQQQIERGDAAPTQLRQRRRHLLKALRKRLPQSVKHSPEKLLHSAVMVLALWGFGGLTMPGTAEAAATFEHVMLNGFAVSGFATPTFADIDNDGDLDAFVGEGIGSVKFYRNDGSASASHFVAADGVTIINPLAGIDIGIRAAPTFVDIDNDGDLDLFVGESTGAVRFYQNDGDVSAPNFVATGSYSSVTAGNVINPLSGRTGKGSRATPTFVDIDNDGDLDAFIGEGLGTVAFYQNDGVAGFIATGVYSNVTNAAVLNPLAGFDVGANAAPAFADIDNDGDLDAFIGENSGMVKFYQNNGSATLANFVAADGVNIINPLVGFAMSYGTSPFLVDIDSDGDLDAFIGDAYGTVRLYQNSGTEIQPTFTVYPATALAEITMGYKATPSFADIDNDGDLDAFLGEDNGNVMFYQNDGSPSTPSFVAADGVNAINPLGGFFTAPATAPTFVDIDNDGDLDAFVGEQFGTVLFYQNNGSAAAPGFVAADGVNVINPLNGFNVGEYASPAFVDIDNDGDLDAFVGEYYGTVKFYQNNGTSSAPNFVASDGVTIINPLDAFDVGYKAAPAFADIDNDGDLDLLVGEYYGTLKFYQNNGTASAPNFVAANGTTVINPLDGFDMGFWSNPAFADIDNDGDLDIFVGASSGKVMFFENLEPPSVTSSGGSGGGGAPGIPLLASLAALLFGRRKSFP